MAKNQVLIKLRGNRTQEMIAAAIGVDRSTYAHIENGTRNPSLALAFKISAFFGVPVDVIFSASNVVKDHDRATVESA